VCVSGFGGIDLLTFLFTIGGVSQISAQQAPPATASPQPASSRAQPEPINFDGHDGWTQIFDGKTLNGWDGSPDVWHVEDGAIVGESSAEHPSGTTNIIWHGGEPANFRLRLEMKLEGTGANGGVQYCSRMVPPTIRPIPGRRRSRGKGAHGASPGTGTKAREVEYGRISDGLRFRQSL
jgi:hypothetical protein